MSREKHMERIFFGFSKSEERKKWLDTHCLHDPSENLIKEMSDAIKPDDYMKEVKKLRQEIGVVDLAKKTARLLFDDAVRTILNAIRDASKNKPEGGQIYVFVTTDNKDTSKNVVCIDPVIPSKEWIHELTSKLATLFTNEFPVLRCNPGNSFYIEWKNDTRK
jgi:hypothetical protein